MKIYSFSEFEAILRFAVHNVDVSKRQIAEEIGLSVSGFNKWVVGANHISVEKGDKLIEWFRTQHLDTLEMAIKCFTD